MPVTRSASTRTGSTGNVAVTETPRKPKRKVPSESEREPSGTKKRRAVEHNAPSLSSSAPARGASPALVPAVLPFSFQDAKQHLIGVDRRFEDMFEKMQCRPFENLERVHPFRALVKSILGQQISWLAARSINHKFIRLYDPSLPEKYSDQNAATTSFPTPQQVADTDLTTLKTAGLSTRKAEYVKDLASRFADGRLSTEKLIAANDEDLAQMLTEVRGIGRWTVDMFAIFSLRRPDILPVGDLGVQRGLLRWFLSLHSPAHPFSISPEKVSGQPGSLAKKKSNAEKDKDALPVYDPDGDSQESDTLPLPDVSSVPPAPGVSTPQKKGKGSDLPSMPTPFTPSINKTLRGMTNANGNAPPTVPLPEGLSVGALKGRLDGKKKIKGAFLTPKEMEDLTESWKPYRSLGVYYMWALE